jgi:hypothetical protein
LLNPADQPLSIVARSWRSSSRPGLSRAADSSSERASVASIAPAATSAAILSALSLSCALRRPLPAERTACSSPSSAASAYLRTASSTSAKPLVARRSLTGRVG